MSKTGQASAPLRGEAVWEAWAERPGLRPEEKKVSNRFDEGRTLRAEGASTCAGLHLAIDEFPFCTRRAAAATTACWTGRILDHRPSPTGRCSPVSPRPDPRIGRGPLPSAPAAASVRRPSEPPVATGRGECRTGRSCGWEMTLVGQESAANPKIWRSQLVWLAVDCQHCLLGSRNEQRPRCPAGEGL